MDLDINAEYVALYQRRSDGDYDLLVVFSKQAIELSQQWSNNEHGDIVSYVWSLFEREGEELFIQKGESNNFPDVCELTLKAKQ